MKLYYKEVSGTILDVKPDKRNECFNWGVDNAFPSLIEALVGMSVTSKTCSDRVSRAIYGDAFGDTGKVFVNSKNQTLNEVLRISSRWYAKQNNCFLQIGYDANLDFKSISVVPTTDCRVGKADDKGYSGKFIVYDNWDKSKSKRIQSNGFEVYDKFNPDKKVVEGQIRSAAKKAGIKDYKTADIADIIQHYNGQIMHIKKDDAYVYSLPELSPVLWEALLEKNSQLFRSNGADNGFLNTKLLSVPKFEDDPTRDEFVKVIKGLKGSENTGGVLLMEAAQKTEDISKQVSVEDLTGELNDKIFEYSDKQSEKNICKAYGVSIILIDPTDSGALGDSGGKLEEAQDQLWESRVEDRNQFEEVFSLIMKGFQKNKAISEPLEIQNPYEDSEDEIESKNINKEAQAKLRGTAAGVTGILSVVKSVKEDAIGKEEAVEIIKNIYGFTEKKAKAMIGGFEEE